MEMSNQKMKHSVKEHNKPYRKLIVMAVLSFISMYILMYAMVDRFANVFPNINQFYMAGLMTMPMIIIEVLLMSMMYKNKKLNAGIIVVSAIALIAFFLFIRQQTAVSDRQFLRGMIPHHAAAILMAENAKLTDPEIKALAEEIIRSQQKEIEQMKAKLEEIKSRN
jgi:hypothetical protein